MEVDTLKSHGWQVWVWEEYFWLGDGLDDDECGLPIQSCDVDVWILVVQVVVGQSYFLIGLELWAVNVGVVCIEAH